MAGAENGALDRIADALERLSPPPQPDVSLHKADAFLWDRQTIQAVDGFEPISLDLLTGINDQKDRLLENTSRHAKGHAAHDVLLWGSRGMGKSALVKSAVKALQEQNQSIALVEASSGHLHSLPQLFAILRGVSLAFILFIDDISFDEESTAPRLLRSMLEGGLSQRPANVRLYVTSNRRHIVSRDMSEQDDPINPRDVIDDRLALSDRFGLRLGFHAASQGDYLQMIAHYAKEYRLSFKEEDALAWSKQRGSRSGRVAWQYIVELAGRAGKSI